MEIKTSFVSPRTLPALIEANWLPVFVVRSISNSELIGKWAGTSIHFRDLAPSVGLFHSFRDNKIDLLEYHKRYAIEVSEYNLSGLVVKLKQLQSVSGAAGIVLMGYGSDERKCHRSTLAGILNESGLLDKKITEIIY